MRDGFVYVYGVSAAHPLRDPPAGVDGMPVEFVDHGSLRALVTRLDEPLTATPGTVRAHWRVLRDVIAQAIGGDRVGLAVALLADLLDEGRKGLGLLG